MQEFVRPEIHQRKIEQLERAEETLKFIQEQTEYVEDVLPSFRKGELGDLLIEVNKAVNETLWWLLCEKAVE